MNFLSQVLSSAEQTDTEIIKQNLPTVIEKVSTCKQEVMGYMDNCYHTFVQFPGIQTNLKSSIDELNADIKDLRDRVQNVNKIIVPEKMEEFGSLTSELICVSVELDFLTILIEVNDRLIEVKNMMGQQLYLECAYVLSKIEKLLDDLPQEDDFQVLESLNSELDFKVRECLCKLEEFYSEGVIIKNKETETVVINTVKFKKDFDYSSLLTAFVYLNAEGSHLEELSEFLLQCLCNPIIKNVTSVKVANEDGYDILTVSVKKNSNNKSYKDIFEKLKDVFAFLNTNFDYKFGESSTISYIKDQLSSDLSNILQEHCLDLVITELKTRADPKSLQQFVADTRVFIKEISELNIIISSSVLDSMNDLETFLINQKCEEFSYRSIVIMKKDLHDHVEVSDTGDSSDEFPKCCVSRSAVELLNLTNTLLMQAKNETDAYINSLVLTVHNIFNQYGDVVYKHHEKFLKSIPQQVALFRNNLMYVAFCLSKFSKTFKFPNLKFTLSFAEHSKQLKNMADRVFFEYVNQQIEQMEKTLNEYQFNSQHLSDSLHPDTDKCIRQCIRQYELLKTVWLKVLPLSVYNHVLSHLLNNFCKKLIDIVVSTEDLPSKNSEQLVDMFKVILTRGPKLFNDTYEINIYVENWQKLNDLVFILNANLMEISDRWADGKGPLTLHFKAEEVRKLIKALFQNSQRRDAVLNRIYN